MAGLYLGIGAGPGIGLSTARRFATEGYRVVLAARKVETLEALADDLKRGPNAGVEIASVDCSHSLQGAELVDRYAAELEVVHYNAAVIQAQTLQEQSLASIGVDIEVNIVSALEATRAAARPVGVGSKLRLSPLVRHDRAPVRDAESHEPLARTARSRLPQERRRSGLLARSSLRQHLSRGLACAC